MHLEYMGFEQDANIRKYIFHRIAHGEETKVFVLGADLALFRRNHVGLQEGPAMCVRVLMAELEAVENSPPLLRRALTDENFQAYLIARGVPATKKHGFKAGPPRS